MITPKITQLNRDLIFRYLGFQSRGLFDMGRADHLSRLQEQITRCGEMVLSISDVRCVYRIHPVSSILLDRDLEEDPDAPSKVLRLEGNDIRRLLDGADEVVLMALTLGADLERLLMREEVTDMSDAMVLDVCASAAVESAADDFEAKLSQELLAEGKYLTNRFSPGYGDLPLHTQRPLLSHLNASRAIGVTLTPTNLMVPRKSVTAIMGICDHIKEQTLGGCGSCPLKTKCTYRAHHMRCYDMEQAKDCRKQS